MNRVYRLAGLARQAAKAVSAQHAAVMAPGCSFLPFQVSCLVWQIGALSERSRA